jgi:hypothetical protein
MHRTVALLTLTMTLMPTSSTDVEAPGRGAPRAIAAPIGATMETFLNAEPPRPLDLVGWTAASHRLGRGVFRPENASIGTGSARLRLPAGRLEGAEIRSTYAYGYGTYEIRMRAPRAPGSLTAFFLYEDVPESDEIDIEIPNDGSRRIILTVWTTGVEVNTVTLSLPFDPADGVHAYRILHEPAAIRFVVDGVELHRWEGERPRAPMRLMSSVWWPSWLEGDPPGEPGVLEIESITAAPAEGS